MAEKRKLQGEIDRLLKKVTEGKQVFQETYEKFESSTLQTQKEKYEADLKKEIKKLQRFRDQIKNWLTNSDIKDKRSLLDARRDIENDMERFKIIERETKTKAYSKEGLVTETKKDPAQKEKEELEDWFKNIIEQLKLACEKLEFEIESCSSNVSNKKKRNDNKQQQEKQDAIREKKSKMEVIKFHTEKLETCMRCLNNDTLDIETFKVQQEVIDCYFDNDDEINYTIMNTNKEIYDSCIMEEVADTSILSNVDVDSSCASSSAGAGLSTTNTMTNSGGGGGGGGKVLGCDDQLKMEQTLHITPPLTVDVNAFFCEKSGPIPLITPNSDVGGIEPDAADHISTTDSVNSSYGRGTPPPPPLPPPPSSSSSPSSPAAAVAALQITSQPTEQSLVNSATFSSKASVNSNIPLRSMSSTGAAIGHSVPSSMVSQHISFSAALGGQGNLSLSTQMATSNGQSVGIGGLRGSGFTRTLSHDATGTEPKDSALQHIKSDRDLVGGGGGGGGATDSHTEVLSNSAIPTSAALSSSQGLMSMSPAPPTLSTLAAHPQNFQTASQLRGSSHPLPSEVAEHHSAVLSGGGTSHDSNMSCDQQQLPMPKMNMVQGATTNAAGFMSDLASHLVTSNHHAVRLIAPPDSHKLTSNVAVEDPSSFMASKIAPIGHPTVAATTAYRPQSVTGPTINLPLAPLPINQQVLPSMNSGSGSRFFTTNLPHTQIKLQQHSSAFTSLAVPRIGSMTSAHRTVVSSEPKTMKLDVMEAMAPFRSKDLSEEALRTMESHLESSYRLRTKPEDWNRARMTLLKNPPTYETCYPKEPVEGSQKEDYYNTLDTNTLFFIFYYFEGSRAQYLASQVLKKRSWRFHKKHMLWFQRLQEPRSIDEDSECGAYIYWDIDEKGNKQNDSFTFEYRYLEDNDIPV